MFVSAVSLAAGFTGEPLLRRLTAQLVKDLSDRLEEERSDRLEEERKIREALAKELEEERKIREASDKEVAKELKIRNVESEILKGAINVREDDLQAAIKRLEPILNDPDVPAPFRARAHGIIANVKKKINLFEEAIKHVEIAHELSPDDYRYLFNRACYRWLAKNGSIDDVLQDLRMSLEKGLSLEEIEIEKDLIELRKQEQFKTFLSDPLVRKSVRTRAGG